MLFQAKHFFFWGGSKPVSSPGGSHSSP